MQRSLFFIALLICLLCFSYAPTHANLQGGPDWMQERIFAKDISISHNGPRWVIGEDGAVRTWDDGKGTWATIRSSQKFKRIDAGNAIVAAVSESGFVYIRPNQVAGGWQNTGIRAEDVGVGGGTLWLIGVQNLGGNASVLKGTFGNSLGDVIWEEPIVGQLTRLDVDPAGRAWGVDGSGDLYVYVDGGWIHDDTAPALSDVGVGGNGVIFGVATDYDKERGGGSLYLRDPVSSKWSVQPGRLATVSVTPEGEPIGVNSLGWLIAGQTGGVSSETLIALPNQKKQSTLQESENEGDVPEVLADLAGDLEIPETIAQAPITLLESKNEAIQLAQTKLNGLDTYIVVIKHEDSEIPSLALTHLSLFITDYIPESGETGIGKLGQLNNPVFMFVHEENANKALPEDVFKQVQAYLARDDIQVDGYEAGISMHATTNGRDFSSIWQGGRVFEVPVDEEIALLGTVSPDLFKKVSPGNIRPIDPALSLNDLKATYSADLFADGKILAYVPSLLDKKIGPLTIKDHQVMIGWGENLEGEVTFDLAIDYVKPEVNAKAETLVLEDVRATFNKNERSVALSVGLAPSKTESLVDLANFKATETFFEGQFTLAEDTKALPKKLSDFDDLELTVISLLETTTAANRDVSSKAKLAFVPGDDNETLIPTLYVESGLTLADIVGDRVPGARDIHLSNVEASTNYIAGDFEIAGSPARVVLYEPGDDDPAIVSVQHQSVDLGGYIPPIRNTSIGSFGMGNVNLFFLANEADRDVVFESLEDVPDQLQPALQNGDYAGLFPLTIKKDVTVVGTYSPAEDGNAAAVMKAYGMDEKGYAVVGSFNFDQIKNAKPRKFDPRFSINKKAACETVTSVDLGGLDLSFNAGDITVPQVNKAIEVKDATFRLREADGQIEPSLMAKVSFNFPDNGLVGLPRIASMGMFSVKGDLNVLCNGPSADDNATLAFVTSTEFNSTDLNDVSFASLDWVTGFGEPPAEDTEEAPVQSDEFGKPIEGWEKPFGLPYLTIRHYASSGSFEQAQDEESGEVNRTLTFQTWADAKINKVDVNVWGDVSYEIKEDTLEVESWSLQVPGPVALAGFPGLDKFPVAKDITLSDIDLSNEEMVGSLNWNTKGGIDGRAYLKFEEEEGKPLKTLLMAEINKVKPSWVTQSLPASILDTEFSPALIGWSNKDSEELAFDDAPEKLQPLLKDFIKEGESITVANGLIFAARTSTTDLLDNDGVSLLKEFATFEDQLVFKAALELTANDELTGEITANLDGFGLKNIPDGQLDFKNTELLLSNLDSNKVAVETVALSKLPNDSEITTQGTLSFERDGEKKSLSGTLTSDTPWVAPMGFDDFEINNVGLKIEAETDGTESKREIGFSGDGRYKENIGTVGISVASADGKTENQVITFEGDLTLSDLFSAPGIISNMADAQISKMIYSTEAIAIDTVMTIGGYEYNGRGGILRDKGKHALFLRLDNSLTFTDIISEIPKPFDLLTIPKGLLIMGSEKVSNFDISGIPSQIHDMVFAGLWDEPISNTLEVDDGLTFLTRMNVDELPGTFEDIITSDPFNISGDFTVGGSVGGIYSGEKSLGFYLQLDKTRPKIPYVVKQLIEPARAAAKLFAKSSGADHSFSVGMSSKAIIKSRRLDDPSVQVNLPTEFSIQYAQQANNPRPTVSLTAAIEGNWQDPFGLEGYALKDPSLSFGLTGEGVLVEVHTDEADFDGKKFVFDLASTWAGNVPTDLSVQFAKSPTVDELVLTPVDMFKLQKSIFDLAFKSSSALFKSIKKQSYINLIGQLDKLALAISDGMFDMLEKSPLSMIGVRDPFIYFGTPGSTPPVREGVERPPFGLGLISYGEMFLDLGSFEVDIAEGEYRVNLKDGYYVSGDVTPPAPFESTYFHMVGAQPLLSPGLGKLSFEGSMKLPGYLIPGIPAEIQGKFDFSRPGLMEPVFDIAGDISIGSSTVKRSASMHLNGTSLRINSSPHGCVDIPVKIDGTIDVKDVSPKAATQLLTIAKPHVSLPDPLTCPEALVKIWEKAIDVAKDPTQLAQDPLAAQKQMMDAAKLAMSALPDNEATRTIYKGMEFADDATNAARNAATAVMNKVPGSQEAQKALSDAQDKAKQAASAAMQTALAATGPVGDLGQKGFDMTKDVAMSGLNALGDVFGDMLGGFSSAWNSLSGGKNYCNARIENMRRNGTAHETKAKVDGLWQRLNSVRVAALESQAVTEQWNALFNRVHQARGATNLWYLADNWNRFAQRMSRTDLYLGHMPSYHKQGAGWVEGRGLNQQETYDFRKGFDSQSLYRKVNFYLHRTRYDKNLLDYIGIIKSFAEKSNFHPGADYPGFRCQKMQIVRMALEAMRNMGITIRTDNTDHFGLAEFNGWWAQVYAITNEINTLNRNRLDRIALIQRLITERNINYVSDIYLGMMNILNHYKTSEYFANETNEDFLNAVARSEEAIEVFYTKALEVASMRGQPRNWPEVVTKQKDVFAQLEQVLKFIYAREVATALNNDWSSKTRMPTVVLPYVKKCLHSFYRSEDSANPFYVRDCDDKMQQALDDIQAGRGISPRFLDDILKKVSVVASTGEVKVREVLKYQFRIWYSDDAGTVRLSTAVSETHPNVDYCLGVPESLSPVISETAIKAVPCNSGDQGQDWTKLADDGGATFFRLQSKSTGKCATWSGVSGVDALVLKDCSEANKSHQVMTAGWPFRNATHSEPRMRNSTGPKKYAFVNAQSGACLTGMHDLDEIRAPTRDSYGACNFVHHHRNVSDLFEFTIEKVGNDNRRLVHTKDGSRKCLVSKNTYVDEFSSEIEPDPAKGFRIVALGACEGEESLWQIGSPGWDGWHEQRYTIREAYGKRQCLTRYVSGFYSKSYKQPMAFLLKDCRLNDLSKKRPDIKIRPEWQQFFPFEVR